MGNQYCVSRADAIDRYQREHSWLGFPIAVVYKFFDDRGPHLAALITYYSFISLFPLLLLFFSAVGFFLNGSPDLQNRLVNSALADFPIVGPQLRDNVHGFHGSGLGLAVGIVGTLYGALGAMQAAQAAFNHIFGVPRNEQPNPLKSRLRSIGLLLVLGTGVLLSTALATVVGATNIVSSHVGVGLLVVGYLLSLAINVVLFTGAYQLLTARDLHFRQMLTGGVIAAVAWVVLQTQGTRFIAARLDRASELYGAFGLVLATIIWIYLEALVLMISAEVNVVIYRRLWPRALKTPFTDDVELTDADRDAYAMYAVTQRFKGFERIETHFEPPGEDAPPDEGNSLSLEKVGVQAGERAGP